MNDFTLGERIRHIRKKLRLNQAQFAAALGIKSGTSVSKYEDDQRRPGKNVLQEIARLGNVSVDRLLDLAAGKPREESGETTLSLSTGRACPLNGSNGGNGRNTEALEMCRRVLESGTAYAAVLELNIRHFYHAALADRPHAFQETMRAQRETRRCTFETQQEKETGPHPRLLTRREDSTHKTGK